MWLFTIPLEYFRNILFHQYFDPNSLLSSCCLLYEVYKIAKCSPLSGSFYGIVLLGVKGVGVIATFHSG